MVLLFYYVNVHNIQRHLWAGCFDVFLTKTVDTFLGYNCSSGIFFAYSVLIFISVAGFCFFIAFMNPSYVGVPSFLNTIFGLDSNDLLDNLLFLNFLSCATAAASSVTWRACPKYSSLRQ